MTAHEEKASATPSIRGAEPGLPSADESSLESYDKDLAATIVPEDRAQEFDKATERRVLRKLDLYLVPWMWIGYGFVYYDKVSKCTYPCPT